MATIPDTHDASPPTPSARLEELTRALEHETTVVGELRETLIQQRAGVAGSRIDAVNQSVDDVGRLLLALEEARGRRRVLVAALAGGVELPLDQLEAALGVPLPAALEAARAALRDAARAVAHEVAINRAVLRRAVETGEAFLQALFSTTAAPAAGYPAGERSDPPAAGVLLNRRA
jgi:hypothetical protein